MNISNTKEFEAAQYIESALNDYNWSPQRFAESVGCFHKTLQQTLMRTLVAIIKNMGSDSYSVDPRNKASHELCKKIISSGLLDDITLPMV